MKEARDRRVPELLLLDVTCLEAVTQHRDKDRNDHDQSGYVRDVAEYLRYPLLPLSRRRRHDLVELSFFD